jgi:hypothetical protein
VQGDDGLRHDAGRSESTSRATRERKQVADSCRLTVTHDDLREGGPAAIYGGRPMTGLETLLETGALSPGCTGRRSSSAAPSGAR